MVALRITFPFTKYCIVVQQPKLSQAKGANKPANLPKKEIPSRAGTWALDTNPILVVSLPALNSKQFWEGLVEIDEIVGQMYWYDGIYSFYFGDSRLKFSGTGLEKRKVDI